MNVVFAAILILMVLILRLVGQMADALKRIDERLEERFPTQEEIIDE